MVLTKRSAVSRDEDASCNIPNVLERYLSFNAKCLLFTGAAKSRTHYKRSEGYTHLVVKTAAKPNSEEIQHENKKTEEQLKEITQMFIWIIL